MTAHHFLRAQNAFSCCDQKPKLTSRKRKYILSHNRDSRDWVGYRDDWLSSSAMWSRTPPLCSASLGIGFNLRPEAIGCSSSKHHIQTWWHLEERGTPSFLWFSLGIRRLFSPPRKFPLVSHWPETEHMLFPDWSLTSGVALLFSQSGPCLELGEESVFLTHVAAWWKGGNLKEIRGPFRKKGNAGWPLHQTDLSISCVCSHWFPCLECPSC